MSGDQRVGLRRGDRLTHDQWQLILDLLMAEHERVAELARTGTGFTAVTAYERVGRLMDAARRISRSTKLAVPQPKDGQR